MPNTVNYLTDIAILLTAAVVAVPFFQSIRMGAVPGFLIAGAIVGPFGLELIGNVEEVGQLAELGVVLLLFIIGIELSPKRLWMMRKLLFGLGSLQVIITSAIFVVFVHYQLGIPIKIALLIGPALALSSTAFVLQLLTENKMLFSDQGRASIAILLLQDLAVVPLLALVLLLSKPDLTLTEDILFSLGEVVLVIGFVILVGRFLLQPILHRVAKSHNPEMLTISAVLLVLGTAVLMEHVGLSMAMGAFLSGLLISDSSFRHQVISETLPFRGLFLGLFFMSMGMSLDFHQLFYQPLFLLSLVAALVILKAIVIWPIARLFGLSGKGALTVALLLAQSGEFALVLFTVAHGAGLLEEILFRKLLLIVILSMMITPFLAQLARKIKNSEENGNKISPIHTESFEPIATPVFIIGFGRVGRKIGRILELANVPFSAIDNKSDLVAQEHAKGRNVFYGEADRPSVLKAMGIKKAQLAIIALDDPEVMEQLVSSLRENFPTLVVVARGHNLELCERLKNLGADVVVSETLETSIELARVALTKVSTPEDDVNLFVEKFRSSYVGKHKFLDIE